MSRHRKVLRKLGLLALLGVLLSLAGSWIAAGMLVAPVNHPVPETLTDLHASTVQIPSNSGSLLRGTWVAGAPGHGAVLLLHGIRADRASMAGRARFLHAAGYAVLMIDMQAHGESPGKAITLGHLESRDAAAAVARLRELAPGERIGVIGVSLGGAAAVLAEPPLDVDALVLEQVYPTIRDAVENRLHIVLGPGGEWLSPLLLWQLRPRLHVGMDALRPIDRVATLSVPKLIVAAEKDERTPLAESRAMFAAAANPKEWWSVPNAGHEDLHALAGAAYESRILAFLSTHLPVQATR